MVPHRATPLNQARAEWAVGWVLRQFFGRYVLKMNPVLLFGACAGAGTVTAALRGIQDEAGSKLPVLGYTVPYAIGNILLTAWGPVIVMLTK